MSAALVLFSGGQDSSTCLAWALARFERVETIGFDYGQRHAVELHQRASVRDGLATLHSDWARHLHDDHLLAVPTLKALGATAMTEQIAIEFDQTGLPNTFVPGRNLLFLTYAAALAYRRDITMLVGGMSEADGTGYPDCRDQSVQAMARALTLGLDRSITVETPLIHNTKAATWALAHQLGGDALIELLVEATHTCYLGERSHRHAWGYGCGTCPACVLRAQGWKEWREAA